MRLASQPEWAADPNLAIPVVTAALQANPTTKAIVYFSVFVGLFQMAILTKTPLFVFGFMGMWCFAALDSWRTASMIRSTTLPVLT